MAKGIKLIYSWFPKLREDAMFKITSPDARDYNCIAWALTLKKVWVWPIPIQRREDDVLWANELGYSPKIENFLLFFNRLGFVVCNDMNIEQDYTKVVLYSHNGNCTHAARQLPNGLWTSKLGYYHDIQHSSPYSLEVEIYGKVAYILKKKL